MNALRTDVAYNVDIVGCFRPSVSEIDMLVRFTVRRLSSVEVREFPQALDVLCQAGANAARLKPLQDPLVRFRRTALSRLQKRTADVGILVNGRGRHHLPRAYGHMSVKRMAELLPRPLSKRFAKGRECRGRRLPALGTLR